MERLREQNVTLIGAVRRATRSRQEFFRHWTLGLPVVRLEIGQGGFKGLL